MLRDKKCMCEVKTLEKKTDTIMIRILELIALLGEATSEEIKRFSKSPSYAEKIISLMKKESYIKNFRDGNKSTYRLVKKGKKYLEEKLPLIFSNTFQGQNSLNRVRDDKRREERRKKLAEVLLLFHLADVKIFPDEKVLLRRNSVFTNADTTDFTDKYTPEFYTSSEIKNIVPDYKKGISSRALGILIIYRKVYIVYLTSDGNLFWRKDTEKDFLTITKTVLARKLFGEDHKIYLLVISDNIKLPSIIMKRKYMSNGKIHPSPELPNMIFALNDRELDFTIDLILNNSDIVEKLEKIFRDGYESDKKHSQYDGVKIIRYKNPGGQIKTNESFITFAFLFDLRKVMEAVYGAIDPGKNVTIFCFDYQRKYIEIFLEELNQSENSKIEILSDSLEGFREDNLI